LGAPSVKNVVSYPEPVAELHQLGSSYDSRKLQLRRCPHCDTYYLYQTDYEFLVNGGEDEEHLAHAIYSSKG